MVLAYVESHCQDVMVFLNETSINITVLAQACYCSIQVWEPEKNKAGRWSVISFQLPEPKQTRLFLHHATLCLESLEKILHAP